MRSLSRSRVVSLALLGVLLVAGFSPAIGAASPAHAVQDALREHCKTRMPPRILADPAQEDLLVSIETICVEAADATASEALSPADGCTSQAYTLAKHRWTVPYSAKLDATNSRLTSAAVLGAMTSGALAWDNVTASDVFGAVTLGGSGAKAGTRDGVNQLGFQALGSTGVLGRTVTWFRTDGTAIESDIIFNSYYAWSTTASTTKNDLQSVATHEVGHALGMSHAAQLTANTCLTMYPSTRTGSTYQRTLGAGDVLGIQKLYGAATTSEPAPTPTPSPTPAPTTLAASFTKHAGNTWWVEVDVAANLPLSGVTASVNGGTPVALSYTSWGSWAKSIYAPAGSSVVFVATSTDGQRATSPAFTW